jgi:hypothetical protein
MAVLVTWDEFASGGRPQGGTIKELVLDEIANVVSKRRPAMAVLGSSDVSNTFVEILEDELDSRAHNAVLEGADFTAPTLQQPTRHYVSVQSFGNWGQVSDEQRLVAHYGQSDPFQYQVRKKLTETLNDIEHATHRGSAASGATSATRQYAGFLNIPSTTTLTASSGTTLTEEVMVDYLQVYRDQGWDIVPNVCFVASYLKRTISEFSTKVTRNVDAVDRLQSLIIERHTSDFGDLDIMYSEDQLNSANKTSQGSSIIFMDPSFFTYGWLRKPTVEQLSRGGFSDRFQINAQVTLIYRSTKAIGGATGLVPYLNQS